MFVEPHEQLENAKQTGMVLGALNNKEWKVGLKRKAERGEIVTAVGEPETKRGMQCGLQDREWKIEWDGNRMDFDGKWDGNKYV